MPITTIMGMKPTINDDHINELIAEVRRDYNMVFCASKDYYNKPILFGIFNKKIPEYTLYKYLDHDEYQIICLPNQTRAALISYLLGILVVKPIAIP